MTLCAAPARPAGGLRPVLPAPLVPAALLLRLHQKSISGVFGVVPVAG